MARRSAAPTYQYEPLITPSEWSGEERNFSIRLTQILDNLHAKIGALTGKATVRELTAADVPTLESRVTALETKVDSELLDQAAALALLGVETEV